jgi:hypothetical protein
VTDLTSRYGTRRRPRWLWPVISAVGITLGIAFAAWVGFQDKPVSAQVFNYEVVDDHQVTMTLEIHRPEPRAVSCTVFAQAADHTVVGEKTVEVPPSDEETILLDVTVQTELRAVNGVLRTCELA